MEATFEKANVCIFKTMIMQFEGDRKDVSSVAVLTELENIKIKQIQREERIRRPDSVWLFKWKEVNRILERVYFYLQLYVVFLSLFKINRRAVSFFVKKYGLHDCKPFLVLCLIFWRVRYTLEDFKKSLSSMCFFKESFHLDRIQESLSLWKVITGLCCLLCLCLYYFLLSSVSCFGHPLLMHVLYYIFYLCLPLKAIRFFCCRIIKKG